MGSPLKMSLTLCVALVLVCHFQVGCPPVNPGGSAHVEQNNEVHSANNTLENDPILSLEYHKYLKEVVNILETDMKFKRMIENASVDDIKSGKIANHLDLVGHNIRTKLDELKRKEIDRLRQLISRRAKLHNLGPDDLKNILPKHIDHNNVDTFEIKDLETLIRQATNDLEEVDKLRREEFKQHEIEKEYQRRDKLEHMNPEMRKQEELKHENLVEKRKHHQKVNHPGSQDQLKEVWKEEDHMEPEKFNPHTFFQLHDLDNNKFLDEFEIEALFQIELDKIFDKNDPEYDPAEREEEANRMREHVFTEIDKDKDMMISFDEFMRATDEANFKKNEEWDDVNDEQQFNQEEFENYSRQHAPTTVKMPIQDHQINERQNQQAQHQDINQNQPVHQEKMQQQQPPIPLPPNH